MKKLNRECGSGAVEFILAFSATAILFLLVIEFVAFAVHREIEMHNAYMASRILKAHGNAASAMVVQEQSRKACEDNPLWHAGGDEPCEF